MRSKIQDDLDKLERIADMLKWNQQKIDGVEMPNGFYELFGRPKHYRHHKPFNLAVRARLINYYNNQLDKMKL